MGAAMYALQVLALIFVAVIGAALLLVIVLFFIDRAQAGDAIRRNYPVIGRFRSLFTKLGEFFRQYFFAMDREEMPFNRAQRDWVYHATKGKDNTVAFGSTRNLNIPGTPIFVNAVFPPLDDQFASTDPMVIGPHARVPYVARSIFNISGMSYGAISRPAVEALSRGAAQAGIWLNTGEGGLSPYHKLAGCDLVFQIGTAKFGLRDEHGGLSDEKLRAVAADPQVKMFELKLAQGAKPGKGGILPAEKVTPDIARIRGIPVGQASVSPNGQPGIRSAGDLLDMIERVRRVTGKPTGIKTVIGSWQWLEELFMEIHERGLESAPDFITVDSGDGGTGAAPMSLMDDVGLNLAESLPLVVDLRDGFALQDRIRIIASGKLITPSMVAWAIAIGADFCVSARGYMFALGCIQAMQCNRNTCPTGVTTHNPRLQRGLVPSEKGARVAHFHANLVKEVETIAHACGVGEPRQLRRHHARMVNANGDSMPLEELWPPIEPGLYLRQGRPSLHAPFARFRVGA